MTNLVNRLIAKAAGLLGYARPSFEHNPEAEKAALGAAEEWLALVDREAYGESWERAAPYFRQAVPKGDWVQKSRGVREPLGPVLSREKRSARYATSLPGAPDGAYVVVQFDTRFQNKQRAVETVTLAKDEGWRATGYFVK